MFTRQTIQEIADVATDLGIEPAALLAVAEVESGGKAFATINGKLEPLIRFEGHYFDRRLTPEKRDKARALGLSSPKAGEIANPKTQAARWRLLARASEIDRKAALESVSWGIGQVMGSHWSWLGYSNVDALANEARSSVGGQIRLMTRYIDKAGLKPVLATKDWDAFARGYNGPGYRRFSYHLKLATAYRKHAETLTAMPVRPPEKLALVTQPKARNGILNPFMNWLTRRVARR